MHVIGDKCIARTLLAAPAVLSGSLMSVRRALLNMFEF